MANLNLEQHAGQDQVGGITRATVDGAVDGDRATTPIAISSESSSELSSDESLGALLRWWREEEREEDKPQSSPILSDDSELEFLESLGTIMRQGVKRRQSICESPPSKRLRVQLPVDGQAKEAGMRGASVESIDLV